MLVKQNYLYCRPHGDCIILNISCVAGFWTGPRLDGGAYAEERSCLQTGSNETQVRPAVTTLEHHQGSQVNPGASSQRASLQYSPLEDPTSPLKAIVLAEQVSTTWRMQSRHIQSTAFFLGLQGSHPSCLPNEIVFLKYWKGTQGACDLKTVKINHRRKNLKNICFRP